MRIFVDENIPAVTVRELRKLGHDVLDIRGSERQGAEDDELWKLAQSESRVFVTTDKGFANHRGEEHHGVLIIRLNKPTEQTIHARVMLAMKRFPDYEWPGLLLVMRDSVQSVFRR